MFLTFEQIGERTGVSTSVACKAGRRYSDVKQKIHDYNWYDRLVIRCRELGYCTPDMAVVVLYHIDGLNQRQVAKKIDRSKSFVARMLRRYKETWPIRSCGGDNYGEWRVRNGK